MTPRLRSNSDRPPLHGRGVVLALVLSALATLLPIGVAAAPPASAATVRAFGSQPFQDILTAADANKKCGLSKNELAVLVMAPIFPEAGGTSTLAPSPMTLSRWDTNATLWAYGDKNTTYQKAFYHPGIGLWQFDSAGGWNMIAADAMNTQTVASVAAKTIADRYCASTATGAARRSYAWGPWYGCPGSCETTYGELFDPASGNIRMENLALTDAVTRTGGVATRSCRLVTATISATVTCYYVDPAAAQGNKSWTSTSSSIPTPISAPFYDMSYNGREWRVWLAQDTGYSVILSADKPVTGNARDSLVWSNSTQLCDVTASRGTCGRVATTPWGNYTANPFGSYDGSVGGPESVTVSGWAIDPDTNDPVTMNVYIDGVFAANTVANLVRSDVGSAVPGYGDNHGFSRKITGLSVGDHQVCVDALNTGATGWANPQLGCKTTTVTPAPPGPFADVNGVHPYVTEIQWLVDQGIASGYPDNTFRPTEPMTRGAMAMFLWRAAWKPSPPPNAPTFSDVPPDHPFATAIAWLAGSGIATGYADGTFQPDGKISRQAMAAFLYRRQGNPRGVNPTCSVDAFTDVSASALYCGEIDWLVDAGITTGFPDGTFHPLDLVTRQTTAAFLYRLAH